MVGVYRHSTSGVRAVRARDREPKRDARGGEMCVEVAIMKGKGWAMKGREMGTHSSSTSSNSDVQLTLCTFL